MPLTETEQKSLLSKLGAELDKRAKRAEMLDRYYDGDHPYPEPVKSLKVTNAYNRVMEMSKANWPKLIIDSVEERLEVRGVRFADETALDVQAWDAWQSNALDMGAGLVHTQALTNGRSYAMVWPKPGGGVTITPEHASTTIVKYLDGTLLERECAERRWWDGSYWYANLYTTDAIYKYRSKEGGSRFVGGSTLSWEPREVPGEAWPVRHAFGVVPVVEFLANPRLRPGTFGQLAAMGEYEDQTGHIDRINYTTFSWLVAMTSMGFDLHALIGDPILYDDNQNPIAPFERSADRIVQVENPDAKLVTVSGTDLQNFERTEEAFIRQLAAITKTPAHYLLGEMVNLSADAIRAAEAGLISKVDDHKLSFGESWEEVLRLSLLMDSSAKPGDRRAAQDPATEIIWRDSESRSLAERADAASKLTNILPWQALAEVVLNLTPQQISRYESMRGSDVLGAMLTAPQPTPAMPTPASMNGA